MEKSNIRRSGILTSPERVSLMAYVLPSSHCRDVQSIKGEVCSVHALSARKCRIALVLAVVDRRRPTNHHNISFIFPSAWLMSERVGNKPFCQDNKRVATSTKSCCLIVLFLDTFSPFQISSIAKSSIRPLRSFNRTESGMVSASRASGSTTWS